MTRPRVFVTRRLPLAVETALQERYRVVLNPGDEPLPRSALETAMRRFDALCPTITDTIDADLLQMADRSVRIIANFGAGVEHVALDAARAAGIWVTNTPGALTEATADLTMMLILMTTRRAGEGERELRAGRWTGWRPTHLLGMSLERRTLGLVGFGRIARAVARRAAAFGMDIAYHSRTPARDDAGRHVATLAAIAEQADVLSLHVPGGPATRHLIDATVLARMRPHSVLVNTARGSIVDENALVAALVEGHIAAAGLDVYEREPAIPPALLACENAVLLPHLGSATTETRVAMGMQMVANLDQFFAGGEPPDRVA